MLDLSVPFNRESAELQQRAGVDPANCLSVEIVAGMDRTPLNVFFGSLEAGNWPSPELGKWRRHDEKYHWRAIREMHPDYRPIVIGAAAIGGELWNTGKISQAQKVAYALDRYVDIFSNLDRHQALLNLSGVDPQTIPAYSNQTMHIWRLKQAAER